VTIVKDGARGALGAARAERARAAVPPVRTVDATGAGDVFDAGFLDAWLSGRPLGDALLRGAICGARAVTRPGGATAAPTRAELERALQEYDPPASQEERT
jgi:sugar/nucleoside kinase (ribokinase family)